MPETTPLDIARAIAKNPGDSKPPTEQQEAVIRAPLAPAIVVAGAGSGKTETMAARVLWLVANGRVRPSEVLGLTFTRKAAGELDLRMRERLQQLRRSGLLPEDFALVGAAPGDGAAQELFDAPRIQTYNSFATTLFRDHAARIGYDADSVVIGEAAAWLLAREAVVASDDRRLAEAGRKIPDVTEAVVRLASAIADNLASPTDVAAFADEFGRIPDRPLGGKAEYADLMARVADVARLPVLLEVVGEFQRLKRERGFIQFSDQVRIALEIVEQSPEVAEQMRAQYRVVILDEYQDTSAAQSRLLAALFTEHPVMAVGDPNQAIFGFRGASADSLDRFIRGEFGPARHFELSKSWRNGTEILKAANTVIAPFLAAPGRPVVELQAGPRATAFEVEGAYEETVVGEARRVAEWFRDRIESDRFDSSDPHRLPDAALLMNTRATLHRFTAALDEVGVPYRVLGYGGLLSQPVVADLVAALRVVADPGAGSELIRLLTGSRWRIGAADIVELHRLARWLHARGLDQQKLSDEVRRQFTESVAQDEDASIVDALDFIGTSPGHGMLTRFSEEGLARMREAARLFAGLRSGSRLELLDQVFAVIQALRLDIEVAANEDRPGGGSALEAFLDAVAQFDRLGSGGTLGGFLAWLREAEVRDRLTPLSDPPEPGCVQILTIHQAKGLEWDLVAVPRLVAEEMPRKARDVDAWVGYGQLPYDFRGDVDVLPRHGWREAATRAEFNSEHKRFRDLETARQGDEARRLAYVALTRPKHRLLVSGSYWSTQASPRAPGAYYHALVSAGIIPPPPPPPPDGSPNPLGNEITSFLWPRDPLGGRRKRVETAAELVRAAQGRAPSQLRAAAGESLAADIELLLAERAQALPGLPPAEPPQRIAASRFHEYVKDPVAQMAALRRPMPQRPFRAARIGTLFHLWVEGLATPAGAAEELDAGPFDVDGLEPDDVVDAADPRVLEELKATFRTSRWWGRVPLEAEREIHLPLGGHTVICKIDAVYAAGDNRYELVDWKTGKVPVGPERELKELQLALYRQAYAEWKGIDPEQIDAVLYYVQFDEELRPERLLSREALLDAWEEAVRRVPRVPGSGAADPDEQQARTKFRLDGQEPGPLGRHLPVQPDFDR